MIKTIRDLHWKEASYKTSDEILVSYYSEGVGRFTVLDRMTGFGWRDIETGFKDLHGRFWLASGSFDIRDHPELSMVEAAKLVKKFANTCAPQLLNKD